MTWRMLFPPGSPYTRTMSDAVLRLQELGEIERLKDKWWNKERVAATCESDTNNSAQLSLANLGGVFIVLLGGMVIACIIAIFEFTWKHRRSAVNSDVSKENNVFKDGIGV